MDFVATVASWLTPTTFFLLLNLTIGTIVITSRFGSGSRKHHSPDPSGFDHTPLARAPSLIDRVKSINFHLYKFPSPEAELFMTHHDVVGSESHSHPAPLARAPSLLDRVKSINLSHFKFPQYKPENSYAQITRPEDANDPLAQAPTELVQFKLPANDEQRSGPGFSDPVGPSRFARAPSILERVKSINFSSIYRSDPTYLDQDTVPIEDPEQTFYNEHKPTRSKSETKKPAKKTSQKMKKSASVKSGVEYVGEEADTVEAMEKRRPQTTRVERSTSFGDGEDGVDAKAADFINKFKQQLKLQRLDSILRNKEMLKSN